MITMLMVFQIIICIFLILIVLMQPSANDGISEFGSGNAMNTSHSVFSGQTVSNIVTKTTYILGALFMINCLVLGNLMMRQTKHGSIFNQTTPASPSTPIEKTPTSPQSPSLPVAE